MKGIFQPEIRQAGIDDMIAQIERDQKKAKQHQILTKLDIISNLIFK